MNLNEKQETFLDVKTCCRTKHRCPLEALLLNIYLNDLLWQQYYKSKSRTAVVI